MFSNIILLEPFSQCAKNTNLTQNEVSRKDETIEKNFNKLMTKEPLNLFNAYSIHFPPFRRC